MVGELIARTSPRVFGQRGQRGAGWRLRRRACRTEHRRQHVVATCVARRIRHGRRAYGAAFLLRLRGTDLDGFTGGFCRWSTAARETCSAANVAPALDDWRPRSGASSDGADVRLLVSTASSGALSSQRASDLKCHVSDSSGVHLGASHRATDVSACRATPAAELDFALPFQKGWSTGLRLTFSERMVRNKATDASACRVTPAAALDFALPFQKGWSTGLRLTFSERMVRDEIGDVDSPAGVDGRPARGFGTTIAGVGAAPGSTANPTLDSLVPSVASSTNVDVDCLCIRGQPSSNEVSADVIGTVDCSLPDVQRLPISPCDSVSDACSVHTDRL